MVAGVAGRVHAAQRAARQLHLVPVTGDHHPLRRHRFELSVMAFELLLAIDGSGTGHQARRVDHVRGGTRVRHQTRIGQLAHQHAGAAGMVEMGVGQQQPVHGVRP